MDEITNPIPCPTPNEDDLSTANTEDSLLGSRKSTETISSINRKDRQCCPLDKKKPRCGK